MSKFSNKQHFNTTQGCLSNAPMSQSSEFVGCYIYKGHPVDFYICHECVGGGWADKIAIRHGVEMFDIVCCPTFVAQSCKDIFKKRFFGTALIAAFEAFQEEEAEKYEYEEL